MPRTSNANPTSQQANGSPAKEIVDPAGQASDGSQPHSEDVSARETRIREAAYAAYQRRGCVAGAEVEDWLQAESEINHQKQ
jgi:hypothetical protein